MPNFGFKDKIDAIFKMSVAFGITLNDDRLEIYAQATEQEQDDLVMQACEMIITNDDKFPSIARLIEAVGQIEMTLPPAPADAEETVKYTEEEKEIRHAIEMRVDYSFTPEEYQQELNDAYELDGIETEEQFWEDYLTPDQLKIAKEKGWLP